MASKWTLPPCACGARYTEFRTGLTFKDVRAMLYRYDEPWRNKRRHGVLGFWHELKVQLWEHTHGACERAAQHAA